MTDTGVTFCTNWGMKTNALIILQDKPGYLLLFEYPYVHCKKSIANHTSGRSSEAKPCFIHSFTRWITSAVSEQAFFWEMTMVCMRDVHYSKSSETTPD